MPLDPALLASALLLGFTGSVHCVGMCGGISAALGAAGGRNPAAIALSYNCGRILCYTALGALVGGGIELLAAPLAAVLPQIGLWLRSAAGLFAIAMGLYVAGWWRGLTRLEAIGGVLWRHVQPFARRLLPPRNNANALLLGALWGLLPCGLVYSSLSWAALNGTAWGGAEWMAAFGLGTLPAMLATTRGGGYIGALTRQPWLRQLAAATLILFGISAALLPWLHAGHGDHNAHAEHQHMQHAL